MAWSKSFAPAFRLGAQREDPRVARRKTNLAAVAALALVVAAFLLLMQPAEAQPLVLEQRVALPSVQGRLDHMAMDIDGNRLFVAALGANSVEVIDLHAGKRITRIEPVHEPQGVAYLASMRRLFVASAGGLVPRRWKLARPSDRRGANELRTNKSAEGCIRFRIGELLAEALQRAS